MTATGWVCSRDPKHPVAPDPLFGWPQCQTCHAGPAYHERPEYLPQGFTVDVLVPTHGQRPLPPNLLPLAPRSALVGVPLHDDVLVYFEGWVNGPAQYADRNTRGLWEAGVDHAAGRMITGYPTVAHAVVKPSAVHQVGTFDPRTRVVSVTDPVALDTWLGLLRLRSDGRYEVADQIEANTAYGCRADDWCILANGHAGDCSQHREVWAGPDVLYVLDETL